ncbi:MAG: xylulokinase [Alphaproteobacteria bacterium]|nr:xylulokinase [Alphaproteobacteria bacterium]
MFLGIDVGTSGVKAILTDAQSRIVDQQTVALSISRPHPLWSEQNPQEWWEATLAAIDQIKSRKPAEIAAVRGIGLAGQMHGAVTLDKNNNVIRPAILWNDGRCEEECRILEEKIPALRKITGNIAMPGFTAPKILWLARHEPENFAKIDKVLLPKDYVRFRFTGAFFSDMSDAAGTLWLDVANRRWSDDMLAACGLRQEQMPVLREGSDVAGILKAELAQRWGMGADVVFAGGAGDNAAGAVGIGALGEGQAFISLGTSGVYFAGTNQFRACPEKTVHAFCHAVPATWHQMGVILSAASCIKSAANFLGASSDQELAGLVHDDNLNLHNNVVFLPYLSGERTPHNNPAATGSFFGLTHETTRADLVQAILEGVAFAFADCQDALAAAGTDADDIMLIGGGARNRTWGSLISAALNKRILYVADGDQGPAFGGAKLARIAATGEKINDVAHRPEVTKTVIPNEKLKNYLSPKLEKYRSLYGQLKPLYAYGNHSQEKV